MEVLSTAWHTFFFTPELPLTLGVFRVLYGLLLLVNIGLLLPDAKFWLGNQGILDMAHHIRYVRAKRPTLLDILPPNNYSLAAVIVIHSIAAFCLMIGWYTTISSVIAFITLLTIQHRNNALIYGGDEFLRIMGFLLMFAPAGLALSVDAMIAGTPLIGIPMSLWAVHLMQLQIALFYFRTGQAKVMGKVWRNGTALQQVLSLNNYRRCRLPKILNKPMFLRGATYAVTIFQCSIALLIWFTPLRYPLVAMAILFHLALEWLMDVQLFGWAVIISLILFIDPIDMAILFGFL